MRAGSKREGRLGTVSQGERHKFGRLPKEARDGLRHDALLLRPRAPLDQHLQVELLASQPFKGVLADGPKLLLVDIAEQTLLKVGIAKLAPRSSRVGPARRGLRVELRQRR